MEYILFIRTYPVPVADSKTLPRHFRPFNRFLPSLEDYAAYCVHAAEDTATVPTLPPSGACRYLFKITFSCLENGNLINGKHFEL